MSEPQFELLQAVQMRGRYEPSAEIKRGLIVDRQQATGPLFPGEWLYSIEWSDGSSASMFGFDLEPATLPESVCLAALRAKGVEV